MAVAGGGATSFTSRRDIHGFGAHRDGRDDRWLLATATHVLVDGWLRPLQRGKLAQQVQQLKMDVDVPVVDAPASRFAAVMDRVLAETPTGLVAGRGPGFVRQVHDGRRAADVIAGFAADPP